MNRTEISKVNESVKIYFERSLEFGIGKLSIEFDGLINENSNGFYKTKCLLKDDSFGFAAATQFEVSKKKKEICFSLFD